MADDKTFEADEHGSTPGPAVPREVRQGGTRPEHADDVRDRSPHDADKPAHGDIRPDPKKGEASLSPEDTARDRKAESQQRELAIDSEDRAAGRQGT